ncbi:GNAT family N-acetyltransferase [Flammeovirga sp. SJP92]|uniref:GNAT family N-acetyltransferase n=1 Tax=Flammeovirga sp. SJP92 TaxID=1775430 RepID=UPI0015600093|nr:GNAT family N-acetyltransferase [Flammeovirga sp. SJP92]
MIECTPLKISDDIRKVAQLIVETDPFIYPALAGNETSRISVIEEMIKKGRFVFCKENIFVAKRDDSIAGLIVCFINTPSWHDEEFKEIYKNNDIEYTPSVSTVVEEYFSKTTATDYLYISNICTAKEHQKKGVASTLVNYIISLFPQKSIGLHVLCDNQNAIRLYEKLGFKIQHKETGFSIEKDKPECYFMLKEYYEND